MENIEKELERITQIAPPGEFMWCNHCDMKVQRGLFGMAGHSTECGAAVKTKLPGVDWISLVSTPPFDFRFTENKNDAS